MTKDTARASTVPEPFGKPSGPGLWHVKGMELPAYVQHVAHDLLEAGHAKTESQAIAMAKGIIAKWAKGIVPGHPGYHVHADVRAAAVKAVAEWEAKRARAHVKHHDHSGGIHVTHVDLARRTEEDTGDGTTEHQLVSDYLDAEAHLGNDHAYTRRLKEKVDKHLVGAGALRAQFADHLSQVHKLPGKHHDMQLAELRQEHAKHHAKHSDMRHAHADGLGLRPKRASVEMSRSFGEALRYDAWGQLLDLAQKEETLAGSNQSKIAKQYATAQARLGANHPLTQRLARHINALSLGAQARKSKLATHLRSVHGMSGSHEHQSASRLNETHARHHAANPSMHHGHKSLELSNEAQGVDLAMYGYPDRQEHPITKKLRSLQRRAKLMNHMRETHGCDGYDGKSITELHKVHMDDHEAKPTMTHEHYGIEPEPEETTAIRLSNTSGIALATSTVKYPNGSRVVHHSEGKKRKKGQYVGFEKLVKRIMAKGKSEEEARAIAAAIGRKKYGAGKFQAMAAGSRRKGAM